MASLFQEVWKETFQGNSFEKARLTKSELRDMQGIIARLQKRGVPSSKIITALQKANGKLSERWKAERVFWTETKRDDTDKIGEAGEELDFERYRVILSPNACPVCVRKSDNGRRVFKQQDIEKAGYGHVPPFHPNCYCIIIPTV